MSENDHMANYALSTGYTLQLLVLVTALSTGYIYCFSVNYFTLGVPVRWVTLT